MSYSILYQTGYDMAIPVRPYGMAVGALLELATVGFTTAPPGYLNNLNKAAYRSFGETDRGLLRTTAASPTRCETVRNHGAATPIKPLRAPHAGMPTIPGTATTDVRLL
jgi:hypothetical protein